MLLLVGVAGAGKSSTAHPEMVHPGHNGTTSERL